MSGGCILPHQPGIPDRAAVVDTLLHTKVGGRVYEFRWGLHKKNFPDVQLAVYITRYGHYWIQGMDLGAWMS